MVYLYVVTGVSVLLSFIISFEKTVCALKTALDKLRHILPVIIEMLVLVSLITYFISEQLIVSFLGEDNFFLALSAAVIFGSLATIPGFVAFPLSGLLISRGIPYTIISSFTTTLMTVGIIAFPFEAKFLGKRLTVMRNLVNLLIALATAFFTGIFYGEIKLL